MRKVIITIAVFMVSAGAARGGTITVGKGGQCDFNSIQAAIDDANDGDTVMVEAGVYVEEIDFSGKAITVSGADGAPVLEAVDYFCDAVSFYNGEGENSILQNFVIRNSYAGVFVRRGQPVLKNLTIVNCINGIEASSGAGADISNCILRDNIERDLMNCAARYSCIEYSRQRNGNISENPLFADAKRGDYHLKSKAGRWDSNSGSWVVDEVTSPCIDAGDWATPVGFEPFPNGGRINMGAFGGTAEASKSYFGTGPCSEIIAGDINGDCIVDFKDFAILASHWLEGTAPECKLLIEVSTTTDKSTYLLGEEVTVFVTAYNPNPEPVTLTGGFYFASYIMDGVYDWVEGRFAPAVILYLTIKPYDSFTWDITHGSYEMQEYPLAIGTHTVVGEVLGYGESAPVEFEVVAE